MKMSGNVYDWLQYPGSFMQRLKKYGVNDARVKVLTEGWKPPTSEERYLMCIPHRQLVWVREVSIYSDKTVWMYARTVIPRATLSGKEKQLQHLKNRSLGSILFKYPTLQRSEFEFFGLDNDWWARRSLFSFHEKSLLLTEMFSPEIATL